MQLKNKNQLLEVLDFEKEIYFGSNKKLFARWILQNHDYQIWRYQHALRMLEYHLRNQHNLRYKYWDRKKNILGARLGIHICPNVIDKGLHIWHYGSIIVNGNSHIGENCQFHGNNCIGNKGIDTDKAPVLGNNVDLGVGAVVIGDIYIANNVRIGANAVVTKSCYESGAILVGNPARKMSKDILKVE